MPAGSTGDFLGGSAEPPIVKWKGKEFKVAPGGLPTVLDRLEKLVAQHATEAVRELKDTLDPDAYAATWQDLMNDLKARKNKTGGSLYQAVLSSPEAGHLYLLALVREYHPDFTEADAIQMTADEPEQVQAAIILVSPDFFRLTLKRQGASEEAITLALPGILERFLKAMGQFTPA